MPDSFWQLSPKQHTGFRFMAVVCLFMGTIALFTGEFSHKGTYATGIYAEVIGIVLLLSGFTIGAATFLARNK